ncbi:hypothetical protein J1605_008129 [Eschrichtius robustus]|uniref:Cyclin-C n=1 Tax=Eschrichtius robustus TaxID=9764 RepID=A0AB34GZV7_ESCRO|nr:hypothetical protein J1605_008129 [Eschrichtius robustus]
MNSLQWILDKQDLLKERQKDLKFLSEEEYWKLQIFFTNVIQALGEHLKLRQQVIATATVYFKRFYARYSLKSIDPVLMAPTCVFLASKVEEFGVVSNTRLISAATSVLKTRFSYAFPKEFPYRMNHILECEFYLLELMDCCLIVYHPYRPLLQYVQDMGQEDMLLPLAWRIVNDTYRTDLCLLYPPFMIALACLHVACVVQQKDARQWFAELSVDMEKILEIIRVILKLYEQWKNFDERKEMATILSKMPKPKPPPNRGPRLGVLPFPGDPELTPERSLCRPEDRLAPTQMRVKEPSKALPEKAKRSKRPTIPHDEDSSDDIAGKLRCLAS